MERPWAREAREGGKKKEENELLVKESVLLAERPDEGRVGFEGTVEGDEDDTGAGGGVARVDMDASLPIRVGKRERAGGNRRHGA